jgi:hypothetical protein
VVCAAKHDIAAIISFDARFLCAIAHKPKVVAATQYVAKELCSTHGSDAKSSSPSVLYVAVSAEQIKATTLKELVETGRANPGKFNYASYGIGTGDLVFAQQAARQFPQSLGRLDFIPGFGQRFEYRPGTLPSRFVEFAHSLQSGNRGGAFHPVSHQAAIF